MFAFRPYPLTLLPPFLSSHHPPPTALPPSLPLPPLSPPSSTHVTSHKNLPSSVLRFDLLFLHLCLCAATASTSSSPSRPQYAASCIRTR
ncbi:unnamed protein product [Hydatigera taeniaeformis]|uniref:Secreted protein n=1 Tax=Hydatigena taeniaeformis TaxID=6205 RepID=A0A0R3XDC1_HYDTA|nr:unnamed protein product [Hydatigera taeniaeformis]